VRDDHGVASRDRDQFVEGDCAWSRLQDLFLAAQTSVDVLALPGPAEGLPSRTSLGFSSTLGALALHCAGLIIDDGWLRVLGGGGAGLPDLATANDLATADDLAPRDGGPYLLIAFDVLGGSFAINGGTLEADAEEVCYFAPDSLSWIPLGIFGPAEFLSWALSGALEQTFEDLRWPGWQSEALAAGPDQAIAVYPPLWSTEGQDVGSAHRGLVPLTELLAGHREAAEQLAGAADGEQVRVVVDE
jgi:Protein of unknown function DUF2625